MSISFFDLLKQNLNEETDTFIDDEYEAEEISADEIEEPLTAEELTDIVDDLQNEDDVSYEEHALLDTIKMSLEAGNLSELQLADIAEQLADYAGLDVDELSDESEYEDDEDDGLEEGFELVSESVISENDDEVILERIIKRIRGGKLQKIKVTKKKRKGFGLVSGKRTSMKVRRAAKRRGLKKRNKKKRGATLRKLRKSLMKRKRLIKKKKK